MKPLFSIIFFLITIIYCQNINSQNVTTVTTNTKSSIGSFIEMKMNETGMVGVAAAIIKDKKLIWMKGYGYADKKNHEPFTTNTIMNIASITKTITGVCLMKAIEHNKVSLDEDINTYLPFKVIGPSLPKKNKNQFD